MVQQVGLGVGVLVVVVVAQYNMEGHLVMLLLLVGVVGIQPYMGILRHRTN